MTINKYFVFVPSAQQDEPEQTNKAISEAETQRQALLKQVQQDGGLSG
ncbi:hypothetical protein J4N42_16840 [Vibrio sp. SCSIO 43135]|nr:hypothetical protein [Vibrio sp. SCSIO 43135]USD43828.1 hypothetical protein J4N42_16840 [Vibrio sp. SCSIO 43135]